MEEFKNIMERVRKECAELEHCSECPIRDKEGRCEWKKATGIEPWKMNTDNMANLIERMFKNE